MAQSKGFAGAGVCEVFSDFIQATAAASDPFGTNDTSAAGAPTLAANDDAVDGAFELLHDNTDELQELTLSFGDSLMVPAGQGWVMEARVKIVIASGASFSADQRCVIGMASARNATLDSVADNAWFRIEGASNVWQLEGDDGTTNTDDQASSPSTSYTDDVYQVLRIDGRDLDAVQFSIDGQNVGEVDVSGMAATDGLQFIAEIQKDGGTETDALEIDYVRVTWQRS